jgi:apolipoprotein N-acyltransferase
VLYALWGQSQFLVFGPIYKWLQNRLEPSPESDGWDRGARSLGVAVLLASLYSGLDWLIPKLFTDTLGHAFYDSVYIRQLADFGGVYMISFVVFIVNDVIAQLMRRLRSRSEPSYWPAFQATAPELLFALLLVVGTIGYGVKRNQKIQALMAESTQSVQAGVIQANIGDFDKFASENGIGGAANRTQGSPSLRRLRPPESPGLQRLLPALAEWQRRRSADLPQADASAFWRVHPWSRDL